MAERPTALVNQILDGIVLQIQTHVETYPHLWAHLPAVVKEYSGESDLRSQRPAILVRIESPISDDAPLNLDAHRAGATYLIHFIDEDAQNPARRGHEGAADIRRALSANEQLTFNGTSIIPSGMLMPQGYDLDVSSPEATAGAVEAVLRYKTEFEWDHTTT